MSLQCPKCSGVIYDRRNTKCDFCGAPLPPELKFTDAEAAAAAERLKIPTVVHVPRFPCFSIIIELVIAACLIYLAVTYPEWGLWILAALYLFQVIWSLMCFNRERRQLHVPRFPSASDITGLGLAAWCIYLAVTYHGWRPWILAALSLFSVIFSLVRFNRERRQYESQKHAV